MKKLPLALIESLQTLPYGTPLVISNKDIVALAGDEYNIQKMSELGRSNKSGLAGVSTQVTSHSAKLANLDPVVQQLLQVNTNTQLRLNGLEQSLLGEFSLSARLANVEYRINLLENSGRSFSGGGGGGGASGFSVASFSMASTGLSLDNDVQPLAYSPEFTQAASDGYLSNNQAALLTALSNGQLFSGDDNINVERVPSPTGVGYYKVSFKGNLDQPTVSKGDDYINVNYDKLRHNYEVSLNKSSVFDLIGVGAGLKKVMGKDGLALAVKHDLIKSGSNIKVNFDEATGQFDISYTGDATAVDEFGDKVHQLTVDGLTLKANSSGQVSVNPAYVRAASVPFEYNNWDSSNVKTSDFTQLNEDTVFHVLPTDVLGTNIKLRESSLGFDLKQMFNVNGVNQLSGVTYLLNDKSRGGSLAVNSCGTMAVPKFSEKKNLVLDLSFDLKISSASTARQSLVFGGGDHFISEENQVQPFVIYWLEDKVSGKTEMYGGKVLDSGTISPNGRTFKASIRNLVSLSSHDQRLIGKHIDSEMELKFITGFKVGTASTVSFESNIVDCTVCPTVQATVTFN